MRVKPTYKEMTPPSTQNLKKFGLWVFFLICCSIFSFISNVEFRLTFEYLTSFGYVRGGFLRKQHDKGAKVMA